MASLLDLVRKLIDYGKELAATLHQRAADNPYFAVFNYATNDLALVLARITRGLQRAAALEERLIRARGRARPDHCARPAQQRALATATSQRKPRPFRPAVQDPGSPLTHMPTAEQIAAEVRRRPIGAVIADICRDLRILPSHPLWRDIQNAINRHGGSYVRLLKDLLIRNYQLAAELVAPHDPPPASLPSPAPACTGPP
jgi:hypothetical protein